MLKIENLHVYYGNIHALKGIDMVVNEGNSFLAAILSVLNGIALSLSTCDGFMYPVGKIILFSPILHYQYNVNLYTIHCIP